MCCDLNVTVAVANLLSALIWLQGVHTLGFWLVNVYLGGLLLAKYFKELNMHNPNAGHYQVTPLPTYQKTRETQRILLAIGKLCVTYKIVSLMF